MTFRMDDLWTIFFLLVALSMLLSWTAKNIEKFVADITQNDPLRTPGPDVCTQGLYRCVYNKIPLGF